MSDSSRPHGLYSTWNSPGQNTGVSSLSLLQGIFPTQELNPGLPYCRRILNQLSHQGNPRIREWVAYPFSSRSSWPRNWTRVSCIAGRLFTNWATREAHLLHYCFKSFISWPCCTACGILVLQPGIKPASPALGVQSLNHWATREVPCYTILNPLHWWAITMHKHLHISSCPYISGYVSGMSPKVA